METNILKFEMQQPNHIISLATSAVLVSVDVNVWSATKQDRGISDEVTQAKKAESSAGRFVKNLLADDQFHKRVSNYRQTIYNWLKRNTFRWNNAQDILPVINLEKFKREFNDHEVEFNRLLDSFINNYQAIVSNMAFKAGDMFNPTDYPSASEVRNKFGIKLYVAEVPAHDWRCQISNDIAEDLKGQYERQAEGIITGILNEQVERLTEVMESISHCCGVDEIKDSQSGETKTKRRKIYESTLEKAKDLCNTFKDFKPVDNEVSSKLSSAVLGLEQTLNGVDSDLIRENDMVRDRVKNDVDDILSKFKF
jgi:hypothetical protein